MKVRVIEEVRVKLGDALCCIKCPLFGILFHEWWYNSLLMSQQIGVHDTSSELSSNLKFQVDYLWTLYSIYLMSMMDAHKECTHLATVSTCRMNGWRRVICICNYMRLTLSCTPPLYTIPASMGWRGVHDPRYTLPLGSRGSKHGPFWVLRAWGYLHTSPKYVDLNYSQLYSSFPELIRQNKDILGGSWSLLSDGTYQESVTK